MYGTKEDGIAQVNPFLHWVGIDVFPTQAFMDSTWYDYFEKPLLLSIQASTPARSPFLPVAYQLSSDSLVAKCARVSVNRFNLRGEGARGG